MEDSPPSGEDEVVEPDQGNGAYTTNGFLGSHPADKMTL